jgi:hypothetical protein
MAAKKKAKKKITKKKEEPLKLDMSFEEAIAMSIKTRMPKKKKS